MVLARGDWSERYLGNDFTRTPRESRRGGEGGFCAWWEDDDQDVAHMDCVRVAGYCQVS